MRVKPGEKSFTLIETVLAVGLLASVLLEVSMVQARFVNFSILYRKMTQATWLAKAVMTEIEYKWKFYPLKDIKAELGSEDKKFPESFCPKDPQFDCDFTYSVNIEDFKLPIVEILSGSMGKALEGAGAGGAESMIKDQVEQVLGKEIFKTAVVTVSWPEGSKKSSVSLPYLLTSQQTLDLFIESQPPIVDEKGKDKKDGSPGAADPTPPPGPDGVPPPPAPPGPDGGPPAPPPSPDGGG